MKKMGKVEQVKLFSEKKKIPRQIKDQLNPLVQKLLNICSSVKVLTRQAEWDEIKIILELLKSIQEIEAAYQIPRSDRSNHWKTFYEWCSENGAEFASITVKEIKDGNYGVFAEKDIKEEEQFLTVPRKIMMSEISAKNSKLDEVFKILRSVARQYCYFFQLFQKDSVAMSLNIGPYFTYDLYRWAVSSVMTRQNITPSTNGQMCISLIPLFDMCNHANGKLTTDFNLENDSLVSYSCKAFSKNDEVFMFYGPRTNGEFLVHNGFVYPENESDAVEIKLGISKNDSLRSLKSSLCDKLNVSVNGPFYIYLKKEIPKDLLTFLEINVMKPDELEKCLNDKNQNDAFVLCENSDLKKRAYSFLKDRLFLLLKSYRTTLEEDEELLKQGTSESVHQHLVLLLRLSEKRILSNAYEYCVKKVEEL